MELGCGDALTHAVLPTMTTIKAIQHLSQLPLVDPNLLLDHSLSSMTYPQSSFHPDPRRRTTRQSLPVLNVYWPDARPPTRPDASQRVNPFLNVASGQAQRTAAWPTGNQASNTFPVDGPSATFPFSAAGSKYYSHNIACSSSGCIPPMHDPAPSTSSHQFQPSIQSFYGLPAGTAAVDMNFVQTAKNLATNEASLQRPYNPLHDQTFGITTTGYDDLPAQAMFHYASSSTQHEAAPIQSGDLGQFQLSAEGCSFYEQLVQQFENDNTLTSITGGGGRAAQFTFQWPPPTQNAAAPVQDAHSGEVQLGTQEHFPLQQAPQKLEYNESNHHQTHEQTSDAALAGPEDISTPVHICSTVPGSACNRGAVICLEILRLYVAANPEALTDKQVGSLVIAATVRPSNSGHSTLGSQDDANNNAIPSLHGATSQQMVSSSSNAAASSSASSSPGGSCFSTQNISEAKAAPSCKRTAGTSTSKKRQRTEDQECPGKQRRKRSTATKQTADEDAKPPRKKKSQLPSNMEWVCVICKILGKGHVTFSRDDSLKRHIMMLHAIFLVLLGDKYMALFRLLQPRVKNQVEDLRLLVVTGLSLQAQARQWGVPIKDKEDLREIHPDMAKMMQMNLP